MMDEGLGTSSLRRPCGRRFPGGKGGAMLMLALSMTAAAGTPAMAAGAKTARPAAPAPARSAAQSSSKTAASSTSTAGPASSSTPEASAPAAAAAAPAPAPAEAKPSASAIFDKVWGYAKVWNDPKNRWLQELNIVGREQFEYEHIESHEGDTDNFANRRARIGLKSRVLDTVTLHSEVDLNLEGDGETYQRLTDSYIRWAPDKKLNLTVGKQGIKFTLDGSISSTQLVTMDRSNVANNFWFPEEYLTGVSVNGEWNKILYNGGWFSSGDYNSEFGNLKGGSVVLLSGGYDLASTLDLDKAVGRIDFVWQDPNSDTDATRPEKEVLSFNFQGEKGRWGFSTDIDWSNGSGTQPDLYGGQALGSMMFCDTWQLVLRYTGIGSNGDNGVRLARYDNKVVVGRGDDYQEGYVGLNKYFYGHKLKWQSGISYEHMHDGAKDGGHYSGFLFLSGVRIAW